MKQMLVILGFIFMLNATASVEGQEKKYVSPTAAEIQKNRACFQDLEVQGCGTEDEDQEQFRACMSNVLLKLDGHCKVLFSELYGSN